MDGQCSTADFKMTTNLEFDQKMDMCDDGTLTSNNDKLSKAIIDIDWYIWPKNNDVKPMKKWKLFEYKTPTKDKN